MAKHKKRQFAEIKTFPNVFEPTFLDLQDREFELKGKWKQDFFKNNGPLVLELGCGKGEYTVGMAECFKEKNFIGFDIKGNRIWRGAKTSVENKMHNVAFVRTHIGQIQKIIAPGECDEIWITFPDPQPRESREHKRLTSPRYLNYYRNIISKEGIIHLKTDNAPLFDYTLEIIKEGNHKLLYSTHDLYSSDFSEPILAIKTHYEKLFTEKGFKICYLKFQLNTEN